MNGCGVVCVNEELDKIEKWFKEFFGKEWEIEIEDVAGQPYVKAERDDGHEFEEIRATVEVNEYGVPTYTVEMTYANRDNEIVICESCHDCFPDDCPIFERFGDPETGEIDTKKLDEYFREKVEEHENKPKYRLTDLGEVIEVKPRVISKVCHVNVTHYHYYRGVELTAELRSFERVKALIELRQFFYDLIDCS